MIIFRHDCATSNTTHTTTQRAQQDVRRSGQPEGEQIQCLVAIVCTVRIGHIDFFVDAVDPNVASNEPGRQETINGLFTGRFLLVPVLRRWVVIRARLDLREQSNDVTKHAECSQNNQVDWYVLLNRTIILVFGT